MIAKKSYTTPVWWLAMIIFLKTALTIISIVSAFRGTPANELDADFHHRLNNQLFSVSVVLLLLLVEAIIYWRIRMATLRKKLVWWHLAGWIIYALMMPAFRNLFIGGFGLEVNEDYLNYMRSFMTVQSIVVLVTMTIGHICFVLVLVDVFKKRKDLPSHAQPDGPDLLNDYA